MSFYRLVLPVVLGLGFHAGPVLAQSGSDPNCTDDRGVDRCGAEQHQRVLDLFGVQPIERHLAAGDQVRRVFYVDGYGRDLVAISFVRAPGRDPMLFVHFARPGEGVRSEPLQTFVPLTVWDEMLTRSEHFDRRLAPLPNEQPSICLHS